LTGPDRGGPTQGATAATGTTRTGGDLRAIATLIAVGIVLRLIIAYVFLPPGSGFGVDLQAFRYWADNLAAQGPFGFYDRGFFADYTPGYLYVLWLIGSVGRFIGGTGDLIKLPAILADGALAYLVWSMTRELGGSRRAALLGAALFLFNPVTWFDSSVWGQVDSFGTVFLLLAVRQLWRGHMISATILTTVAAIIKPQFGILIPIAAVVILRRYLVARPERGDPPGIGWSTLARVGVRVPEREGLADLAGVIVAGVGTAFALSIPFALWPWDLARKIVTTAAQYSYLTVNAYNPWALLSLDGNGVAANGTWVLDAPNTQYPDQAWYAFGPLPAVVVGTALLLAMIGALCIVMWRRDDRRTLLVALAVMAIAFFILPTRVHERYMYPFFALGAILAATSFRWRIAYLVLAVASFLNLYVVLAVLYENPGIEDWLGVGTALRSTGGVAAIAIAHVAVFLWALTRLRRSAVEADEEEARDDARAEDEEDRAREAPAPARDARRVERGAAMAAASAAVAGAGPTDGMESGVPLDESQEAEPGRSIGALGWLRGLARYPVRDRSWRLAREAGGKVDRLDIWIVVVLVVAALVLRTYRLAEPYRMHFDEVYHARTATEFLQFWRYGEKHDIYEYTHPHFAKYAIAAGIAVAGNNRVTSTSDIGMPVSDAAIEPHWEVAATSDATGASTPAYAGGGRIYVATGTVVQAYDLESRALVATIDAPGASALAMDESARRLLIGTAEGAILAQDTQTLDGLTSTGESLPAPPVFATLDAAVRRLFVTSDGATIAAGLAGDVLATVDAASGEVLGRSTVPGLGGLADGTTADALLVDTSAVQDPAAFAAEAQRVAGLEAADVTQRIADAAGGPVTLAGRLDPAVRTAVEGAIAAGSLPSASLERRSRVAAAADAGVVMVDAASAEITDTISIDGTPRDLVNVTGVGDPAIYAAGDSTVWRIEMGDEKSAALPSVTRTTPMPGAVSRILYDTATQLVHVAGVAPDGSGATVYVVEPNGNAVFADAELPFDTVSAWALDSDEQHPATDRQQILAFAPSGASAAVSVGGNAFGWRLPGVIFGALTLGVLYLLARMLFRRRSVAVLAGILVLADGMMFVQSRIAMNDVYVGFFILAAFALFAALWTGRLKGWVAFALGMPMVGLLLGLGLASKWVALYALGGIGILILARSALGRIILILGLAALTATLGYMAIAVSSTNETSGGNILFLLLTIGLTLLAVVASVLHPVEWTLDEMRFAVWAPGVLGIAGALVAFAVGIGTIPPQGDASPGLILLALSGALVALSILAILAFRVAARFGLGPLSPPPEPDDPVRLLDPPDTAPDGWMRLGSGWGLPAVWLVVSLALIPFAVYVISYLPWVALGNRLTESFPAGNTGQTLIDLTKSMYDYHNNLRATHAASSPWWAWPFDLKPVWFYQGGFEGTSAAIYDSGNLGIWWMGVAALPFVAWQAFKRRSLALALIGVGFFVMWLPWVRIDRATFQYHYYTALIFLLLAVAYLFAEVWNGPSRRTWLMVRVAAAIAIMGPALLWLFRLPLCAVVGVDKAYPNSPACSATVGELVVTQRIAAIAVVLLVTGALIAWQVVALERDARRARRVGGSAGRAAMDRHLVSIGIIAVAGAVALLATGALSETLEIVHVVGINPEVVALALLVPLGLCAYVIVTARDSRRFTLGFVWAAVLLFVFFYPNISALPLPSELFNAYQGILPTWLYVFQFPVNTDPPVYVKLLDWWPAILFAALLVTAAIVGYSAWSWRIALAERAAERDGTWPPGDATDEPADEGTDDEPAGRDAEGSPRPDDADPTAPAPA
jgi:dolichyl-phosphate-mannose--protein O-mannosyl transferase